MVDAYIDESLGKGYHSLEFPLIHKCDSVKVITSIIENGFRFSYSKETICDTKRCINLFIPMISFSDLDYNTATRIMSSYGQLAIGMKKEWAQKNGLTPVLYFERNSKLTESLLNSFEVLEKVPKEDIHDSINEILVGEKHKFYKFSINITSHSKNFYAPLVRKGIVKNYDYCFGAEREWRLVLLKNEIKQYLTVKDDFQKEQLKANKEYLNFDFNDIEYFVYEADFEKDEIIKALKRKFKVGDKEISQLLFHLDYSRYRVED